MPVELKSLKNNIQSTARHYFTCMLQETQNREEKKSIQWYAQIQLCCQLCGTPAVTLI